MPTITLTFDDADASRLSAAATAMGWTGSGDPLAFLQTRLVVMVSEAAVNAEYAQSKREALARVAKNPPLRSQRAALQQELEALQQEVAQYRGTVGTDAEEARERAIDRRIGEIQAELA